MHLVTTNEALVNIVMFESDFNEKIHQKASEIRTRIYKTNENI